MQNQDGLAFMGWVDSNGKFSLTKAPVRPDCLVFNDLKIDSLITEKMKKDISGIINSPINELKFQPKEYQCMTHLSKIRLIFGMGSRA